MTLITNAAGTAFASPFDIDKIVGVWEGSFNRATDVVSLGGDLGNMYVYRFAHSFTRPLFLDLIWKISGSWTDGGSIDSVGDTSIAFCDYTNVNVVSSVFAPAVGTFQYKVIGTWINEFDATNPLVESFQSATKSTNFDSRDNYQKIYDQNVLSFNADGSQAVAHDLNRKANFRVFYEALPDEVWPAFAGGASNPFLYSSDLTECEPYITTTALNVRLTNVTLPPRRAWYKIYLDT